MTCKEATRLVSESLDRELPLHQRLAVKAHFRICVFCKRYWQQLLFIRDAIRGYSKKAEDTEFPPRTSLSPEAREQIKRKVLEQSQNRAGNPESSPDPPRSDSSEPASRQDTEPPSDR